MTRSFLVAACLACLCSCGGGGASPHLQPTPPVGQPIAGQPVTGGDLTLGILRSASGLPLGVRVSWSRVNVTGVQGYYVYRDTTAFPDGAPTGFEGKRTNSGNMVNGGNPGSGNGTQTFDDLFGAVVGTKYFYRMTVVNSSGDESDFSAELSITIAQQTITTVTQAGGDIVDQVTIAGTWFGSSRSGDQVFFSDSTGAITVPVAAADYVSWSQTQIVVKVPYGAADGKVAVQVGTLAVSSPDGQVFDYNEPGLATVAPLQDWAQHDWVVLTGTHFGPAPDAGGTATKVWFGSVAAQNSDIDLPSWTSTNIKLKVPAAAPGQLLQIQVDVAGNLSGGQDFTVLPHLTSLDIDHATPGTTVYLTGTGFGAAQGTGSVSFDGTPATVVSWNNQLVSALVPDAALDGGVKLVRGDSAGTNQLDFDVVPRIDNADPFRRMTGEQLTLNGAGFGASQLGSSVTFLGGNVPATNIISWSPTQIVLTVPVGATTGNLRLHVADNPVGADLDSADTAAAVKILLPAPGTWGAIGQL
jgi:hypothetical protein